jgi:truncated hemoglobin YjbI
MSEQQPPTQSQSISGNITGSVQIGQAGGDLTQTQRVNSDDQTQGITAADVGQLLEKLQAAVKASGLSEAQQEEVLDYLKIAKREAGKESADKNQVGNDLKRASEAMKHLKETTEAGKSLWQTGTEVFKAIAPWLGVAVHFFGI